MKLTIEGTQTAAGTASSSPAERDAAQVFSLLDQLRGRSLDPGTAELVAQLTAELRKPTQAKSATVELRSGDDFHEGFAHVLEDLSARLRSEGKATLGISYSPGRGGSTMHIDLSGPPKIVEAVEREIAEAARGAVDLRWS
jgi:hypothetical protein